MLMISLFNAFTPHVHHRILIAILALTVWGGTMSPGHAAVLNSFGDHIPLGPFVTSYPAVAPVYTESPFTSFTGTWSAPAQSPWHGTFTGTGPIPAGNLRPSGISTYDFTGLAAGALPTGTFFFLTDLDNGSGSEKFSVQAFDSTHTVISSAWLNNPALGHGGIGAAGGAPQSTDAPGWDWGTIAANTYTFDGTTINTGNPSISLALGSNQAISYLEITRGSSFANFALGAPVAVPEPATVFLLAGCFGASFVRRQWRRRIETKS